MDDIKELTDALQNQFSSGAYTHHQKSVICDADPGPTMAGGPGGIPGSSRRRLVAFVGGLDLTGGRYDTPDHELFKTLLTEHGNDEGMYVLDSLGNFTNFFCLHQIFILHLAKIS